MSIARSLTLIIAGLAAVLLGACRETPSTIPAVLRLSLDHPDELVFDGPGYIFGLALAPDGRRLAFPATSRKPAVDGPETTRAALWVRDLTAGDLRTITGTEGALFPFWSPDGRSLAFFSADKLRAISLADGAVTDLADAPNGRGGAWHSTGDIVFAPRSDGPLVRRNAAGAVEPFTALEDGELSHRLPSFVGDTHIIFFVRAEQASRQGIWIAPIDNPAARKRLVNSDAAGLVIDRALLYAGGDALVLHPINLERLSFDGASTLVGSPVGRGTEHQLFAATGGEVLLFGQPPSALRELRWVDSTGAAISTLGEPMIASDVRIAPRGARVAVARADPQLRTLDIWTYDSKRPLPRRISSNIDSDESPVWSHDGSRIAWVSGRRTVMSRRSDASAPDVTVAKFDHAVRLTDWSPDGRWLVVSQSRPGSRADIVLLAAEKAADVRPYAQTPFDEAAGVISPDGKWLAYMSDESGQPDIYVDSFPTPGNRARLTVGGGMEPRWSRIGRSIFFRRGSQLHEVTLEFEGGVPGAVASEQLFDAGAEIRAFDASPDEPRWLLNMPTVDPKPTSLTAIVNVRSLLPSAP